MLDSVFSVRFGLDPIYHIVYVCGLKDDVPGLQVVPAELIYKFLESG